MFLRDDTRKSRSDKDACCANCWMCLRNSDVALGSALRAAPTGGKRLQVPLPCTFSGTYLPVATSSLINGYQAIEDLLETSILISPRPSTRGLAFAEALVDHSAFMIISANSPVARSDPEGELDNSGSL